MSINCSDIFNETIILTKDMRGKIKNQTPMENESWNKLQLTWKMNFTWINKGKNASQQRSCAFINFYISGHLNFIWSLNLRTSRNVFCSSVILQSKIILLLSSFSQYIIPTELQYMTDLCLYVLKKQEIAGILWQDNRNSLRNSTYYNGEEGSTYFKACLTTICIFPATYFKIQCTVQCIFFWKANTSYARPNCSS